MGLKHCPTPSTPNAMAYEVAINQLYRKLLIQAYYAINDEADTKLVKTPLADLAFQNNHKTESKWMPQPNQVCPVILNFADELKFHLI